MARVRPASQAQPPPRKTAMVTQAAPPSLASKRSRAGESSARRTAVAAPATRQASASGLRAIQVSSAAGKAASAAGCAQNEETDSVRRPGERGHPAGHQAGPRPRVTAGARPAVPEVPAADDHDRQPGQEQRGRDGQARRLAAGEPRRHGPRHRQRGEQRQEGEDQDRSGHHERGHGGARGVRRGPLPADDELGPDGAADAEEDGRAAGERGQAGPGLRAGQFGDLRRRSRTGRRRRAGRRARP